MRGCIERKNAMKRWIVCLAALVVMALPLRAQNNVSKVLFSWDYNFGTDVPCTTTTTVNCISGYRLQEGSTVITVVNATTATSYTYTLAPLPAAGSHTYTLVATKVFQGGVTIDSAPATGSLQVPSAPNSPAAFSVTFQ